ncbi:cytochrome P450 family protein [Salix suchowensis]|nr:cytochrome P450 family protein [Salix suchowensis]
MWVLFFGALIIISITHWVHRWRNPRCNGTLPPGSMGLPLIGETLQFFAPSTLLISLPLSKKGWKVFAVAFRYGPIFRTNLVGRPVIVSTDPDLNHFIFQQEGQLFQSWYPDTFTEIFGRQNVEYVLNLFGPESLKKMLPEVEQTTSERLQLWSHQESVELKETTATMIFDLTAKKLISYDQDKSSENLRDSFVAFIQGLISFPLDIPGTAYHNAYRKKAMRMLKKQLQERRANPRKNRGDFFDYVLEELQEDRAILTEAIALDLMFVLLFATVKFLSDNPLVLRKLTEEHDGILRNRVNSNSGLTWNEYKSMKFTFQVINETVRLANIVPGIFRKALRDIQFKGYTIPEGWAVMVCPPAVHLSPAIHEDPLAFNPWRWEVGNGINGASKKFMAFGGGMRFCVGTEFTKVQMAVFLHCLVTKYRWQAIKGGNIVRTPWITISKWLSHSAHGERQKMQLPQSKYQ